MTRSALAFLVALSIAVPATAKAIRKSPRTLRRWRANGSPRIPWYEVGGRILYAARDVETFVASCRRGVS